MPIIVKDYTWKQTPTAVHITIPLNPVKKEKVDLFATDSYIKAHYSPFLLEVFLLHDVDMDRSRCVVRDDLIELDLVKREERHWERLERQLSRADKMTLRQRILETCQEKAKVEAERKRIKKSEMDRFTVQKAMEIDSQHHSIMDSRRDEQRKIAMEALEDWRVNADTGIPDGVRIAELPDEENEVNVAQAQHDSRPAQAPATPRPRRPVRSEYVEQKKAEAARRALPPVRGASGARGEGGELRVRHTPRAFPTPSRESARAEEEAWLKNITLARRATGFVSEELRPEEQDPQWCKSKGDEFFRAGNFLGAVSAYTHGIQLAPRLPSLFANRAATHFALGNFNKCVTDCSRALELQAPACEGNRRARAACLARRGAGLARLGYLSKAIGEMKAAARLLPDDASLQRDIHDMERAWEQNPDSD